MTSRNPNNVCIGADFGIAGIASCLQSPNDMAARIRIRTILPYYDPQQELKEEPGCPQNLPSITDTNRVRQRRFLSSQKFNLASNLDLYMRMPGDTHQHPYFHIAFQIRVFLPIFSQAPPMQGERSSKGEHFPLESGLIRT